MEDETDNKDKDRPMTHTHTHPGAMIFQTNSNIVIYGTRPGALTAMRTPRVVKL